MIYSNPVKDLTIQDWPYGRKRVKCVFSVETVKGKQRAVRITDNPNGGTNKPKKMTYAEQVVFVTGDDDKTYILELSMYSMITVMQSNFKYQQEVIHENDPQFNELLAMFEV